MSTKDWQKHKPYLIDHLSIGHQKATVLVNYELKKITGEWRRTFLNVLKKPSFKRKQQRKQFRRKFLFVDNVAEACQQPHVRV